MTVSFLHTHQVIRSVSFYPHNAGSLWDLYSIHQNTQSVTVARGTCISASLASRLLLLELILKGA